MLSIAIIIFREILEVALILTTLLVETRALASRHKWIWSGLMIGVIGACVVALFTDVISSFAEGMGQEIFNAGVLVVAAILIGWTVVWMTRHGRELTQHFKEVGIAVQTGKKPLYALTVAVALSVLREGSEIVLFTYGIAVSGASFISLIVGSLLGLAGGVGVGVGLYYGLVHVSPRHLFSVTSWLLILLAAGMISQATGLLQAGGVISILGAQAWDTSHIVSEQSLLGSILHTLIGYTAQPSYFQLIMYIVSFSVLVVLLKFYGEKPFRKKMMVTVAIFLLSLLGFSDTAFATKKVYSPIILGRELEIEARGGYDIDKREDKNGAFEQKYAVGYGVTEWWFTEIYGEIEREADKDDFDFTAVEWENRFQLAEQGEWPIDVGLYFAYETTVQKKTADKIEGKILLEKSLSKFTHTANIIFEKEVGGGSTEQVVGGFAWSSRYRWNKHFEPGFEWHSDFGELKAHKPYDEQTHQLGPVFYGRLTNHIKYDVGYLFGLTDPAPQGMFKWIFEYEFMF